jgi:hypothetical protein
VRTIAAILASAVILGFLTIVGLTVPKNNDLPPAPPRVPRNLIQMPDLAPRPWMPALPPMVEPEGHLLPEIPTARVSKPVPILR